MGTTILIVALSIIVARLSPESRGVIEAIFDTLEILEIFF
jgi:hypothetical protein